MNKIIKSLVCIGIALSLFAITSCDNTRGSVPMLKITTSTENGFNLNSKEEYYIVYGNDAIKKTSKFDSADVIYYFFLRKEDDKNSTVLRNLDINTPQGVNLKKIASDILLLTDKTKLKIISFGRFFALDDRYFFTVLTDNGEGPSSCKLFEYRSADKSIKEIVSFNKKCINHVELYESSKR